MWHDEMVPLLPNVDTHVKRVYLPSMMVSFFNFQILDVSKLTL